jgi:hypothetical protein
MFWNVGFLALGVQKIRHGPFAKALGRPAELRVLQCFEACRKVLNRYRGLERMLAGRAIDSIKRRTPKAYREGKVDKSVNIPMTSEEKAALKEWKELHGFVTPEDKRGLPSSIMNLWLGESGAKLVRHPLFPAAIERARKAKSEFDKKVEIEAALRLQERFLEFWYYRGIAYGCNKYQKRAGDSIFPVVEFFLKRNDQSDAEIKIWRYDLPIANGQEVAVIYGRKKGEETGYPIVYCNYDIRRSTRLNEAFNDLARKSSHRPSWGVSPEEELKEFMARNQL